MNPQIYSTMDALHLTSRVEDLEDGVRAQELQALSYLACIMSIFDGWSIDTWGYSFAATGAGAPFSRDLSDSLVRLVAVGLVEEDADSYRLSPAGNERRSALAQLSTVKPRLQFLDAAADTTLALAIPTATGAVLLEPQLRNSVLLSHRRRLLDETGLTVLAPYLEGLRANSPGGDRDLFAAAVLWLKYLLAEPPSPHADV